MINFKIKEKLLKNSRIYIFPTKLGAYYFAGTFLAFVVAVFYGNSFAYAITFFFFSFLMAVSFATNFSLKDLEIKTKKEYYFIPNYSNNCELTIVNHSKAKKIDIAIECPLLSFSSVQDLAPGDLSRVSFSYESGDIKRIEVKKITISSTFPFGLYRAWMYIPVHFYVYCSNRPSVTFELEEQFNESEMYSHFLSNGSDELLGVSPYQEGDQMSLISWKDYAKSQELLVKKYGTYAGKEHVVDFNLIEGDYDEKVSKVIGASLFCIKRGLDVQVRLNDEILHSSRYDFLLKVVKGVLSYEQT